MKNKQNLLQSFLGFTVRVPVFLTSSTVFISSLVLFTSLFTTHSKSIAQNTPPVEPLVPAAARVQQPATIKLQNLTLMTVGSYCKDLASWANSDNSGTTYSLTVTVVTNNPNGLGRLYTGTVGEKVSNFLGRADQFLFSSGGDIYTNRRTDLFNPNTLPFKGGFNWVCNSSKNDQASISITYPEYTNPLTNAKISSRSEGFKVKNIKLVNNLLYGQVEEADGKLSEAIISFQKYSQGTIK